MAKNIALFVDGTRNRPFKSGSAQNSNVRRLFEAAKAAHQQADQLAYMWGIGRGKTAETVPGGEVRYGGAERFIIGISGLGMAARVRWAYKFLASHYDRGDRTYIFGFSRGAFGARSIVGFAGAIGLLLKDAADEKIEEAWRIYETYDPAQPNAALDHLRSYLRPIIPPRLQPVPNGDDGTVLPIHLIAVWDTVAALGLPGLLGLLTADRTKFHQTDLPEHITHARHALALHELRQDFEPLLWPGTHPNAPHQTLKQTWFVGAHANVGGSEPAGAAWADIPLQWIAQEAQSLKLPLSGLPFATPPPVPTSQIANSRSGVFTFADFRVRPDLANWEMLEARTTETFQVDPSVAARLADPGWTGYAFDKQWLDRDLGLVDDVSLHMLIAIRLRQSPSSHSQSEWWKAVRAADLAGLERALKIVASAGNTAAVDQRDNCARLVSASAVCLGAGALTRVLNVVTEMEKEAAALLVAERFADGHALTERINVVADVLHRSVPLVTADLELAVEQAATDVGSAVTRVRTNVISAQIYKRLRKK